MRNVFRNTDYILLGLVIALVVIGIIGIYSAGMNSTSSSDEWIKQIIWIGISLVVMFAVWMLDYHLAGNLGIVGYPMFLIALIVVLFMPEINGASSWFNLGGFLLQPSEFMKIAYILAVAKYMEYMGKGKEAVNKWQEEIPA